MKLLEDFVYEDPRGRTWKAPKGTLTDGASIPRVAWTVAGNPHEVPYRDAAIIHDYYCDTKKRSWQETHRVFYDAMITAGTSKSEALIKYWAVVRAGPRWSKESVWSGLWPFKKDRNGPPPAPPSEEDRLAQQKQLEEDFALVRASAESGSLSADDVVSIADAQIVRSRHLAPLSSQYPDVGPAAFPVDGVEPVSSDDPNSHEPPRS